MSPERKEREGVVWRLDPKTLKREEVTQLIRPDDCAQYVSRGAVDKHGNLFFGHSGQAAGGHLQGAGTGRSS